MKRTDWNAVMKDCGGAAPDDNSIVAVTRGAARLALSALREQNVRDYYHNYGAAEREVTAVLERPAPTPQQQIDNLNHSLAVCEHYCATQTGALECNCGSWYFRKLGAFPLTQRETLAP